MPAKLHLDPDRLRAHASAVAELAARLHAAVAGPLDTGPGAGQVVAAVRRVAGELDELDIALTRAARAAGQADEHAAQALRRARP